MRKCSNMWEGCKLYQHDLITYLATFMIQIFAWHTHNPWMWPFLKFRFLSERHISWRKPTIKVACPRGLTTSVWSDHGTIIRSWLRSPSEKLRKLVNAIVIISLGIVTIRNRSYQHMNLQMNTSQQQLHHRWGWSHLWNVSQKKTVLPVHFC